MHRSAGPDHRPGLRGRRGRRRGRNRGRRLGLLAPALATPRRLIGGRLRAGSSRAAAETAIRADAPEKGCKTGRHELSFLRSGFFPGSCPAQGEAHKPTNCWVGGADEREHPDDGAELHHASQDERHNQRGLKATTASVSATTPAHRAMALTRQATNNQGNGYALTRANVLVEICSTGLKVGSPWGLRFLRKSYRMPDQENLLGTCRPQLALGNADRADQARRQAVGKRWRKANGRKIHGELGKRVGAFCRRRPRHRRPSLPRRSCVAPMLPASSRWRCGTIGYRTPTMRPRP